MEQNEPQPELEELNLNLKDDINHFIEKYFNLKHSLKKFQSKKKIRALHKKNIGIEIMKYMKEMNLSQIPIFLDKNKKYLRLKRDLKQKELNPELVNQAIATFPEYCETHFDRIHNISKENKLKLIEILEEITVSFLKELRQSYREYIQITGYQEKKIKNEDDKVDRKKKRRKLETEEEIEDNYEIEPYPVLPDKIKTLISKYYILDKKIKKKYSETKKTMSEYKSWVTINDEPKPHLRSIYQYISGQNDGKIDVAINDYSHIITKKTNKRRMPISQKKFEKMIKTIATNILEENELPAEIEYEEGFKDKLFNPDFLTNVMKTITSSYVKEKVENKQITSSIDIKKVGQKKKMEMQREEKSFNVNIIGINEDDLVSSESEGEEEEDEPELE